MEDFYRSLKKTHLVISHNIMFDCNVVANHLWRYNLYNILDKFLTMPIFCTSINSTNILKIPLRGNSGKFKYPSLSELYFHYFKQTLSN